MIQQAVAVADTTLRAQVFSRIDAIGAKLGVAADHLWPILVRQSYATAVMGVIGAIFATAVAVRLYTWIPGLHAKSDDDGYFFAEFLAVAGFIGCCALTLIFLLGAAGRFINPEFYALRSVLDMLTGK